MATISTLVTALISRFDNAGFVKAQASLNNFQKSFVNKFTSAGMAVNLGTKALSALADEIEAVSASEASGGIFESFSDMTRNVAGATPVLGDLLRIVDALGGRGKAAAEELKSITDETQKLEFNIKRMRDALDS